MSSIGTNLYTIGPALGEPQAMDTTSNYLVNRQSVLVVEFLGVIKIPKEVL